MTQFHELSLTCLRRLLDTQNYTILERALPLLEQEYNFWVNNRTVTLERAGRNYSLVSKHAKTCIGFIVLINTEPLRCFEHSATTGVVL